jgi:carboxypeptidase Taq
MSNYPRLQEFFPEQLSHIPVEKSYKGINRVSSSLIRTEADEISYHLHVMIRYEIEKGLITGSLKCKDIPALWSELYMQYLDVKVPDDKQGCLQDVHWSHGSFGYFPTYSIGSLYAAQFYAAISADIPSIETDLQTGNNLPVAGWLQQHIYKFGRYYYSNELCMKVTGKRLDSSFFLNYASKKYAAIYDFV